MSEENKNGGNENGGNKNISHCCELCSLTKCESGEDKMEDIMPLDRVLKLAWFRSTPAPFVNFFLGIKHPPLNVLRLAEECANDMDIDFDGLRNFLKDVMIELEILKPLAEEAYNINKLIKQYQEKYKTNTEEMSPELKALFTESSRLTLWIMGCYSIQPEYYFMCTRNCCKKGIRDNQKLINIPGRGMIQYLLLKTLGLILAWMVIHSHAKCITDIEQKINSIPSILTPLVDQIRYISGKYRLLAHISIKKTCLWYKILYKYSCNIPCADDHLLLKWDKFFEENKLTLPSRCSPFRAQCGPFRVLDLITQFDKNVIYFRSDKTKNLNVKTRKDYFFKMMPIFGNIDEAYREEVLNMKYIKNTFARMRKQIKEEGEEEEVVDDEEDRALAFLDEEERYMSGIEVEEESL